MEILKNLDFAVFTNEHGKNGSGYCFNQKMRELSLELSPFSIKKCLTEILNLQHQRHIFLAPLVTLIYRLSLFWYLR
jgi:hypothetical protein